jgi:hypothetical protein
MKKLTKAQLQLLNILTDLYFASDNAIIGISFETFVSYSTTKDVRFITDKTFYNN